MLKRIRKFLPKLISAIGFTKNLHRGGHNTFWDEKVVSIGPQADYEMKDQMDSLFIRKHSIWELHDYFEIQVPF